MKLSIIVPVYGVELYIEKCIQSLLHQDLPKSDYEIIFVNDETQDDSWEIVKEQTKDCTNVLLLEQRNQGQGMARNYGLAHAKGDFVWFIDSDDWIEENCLIKITQDLQKDTDILAFSKYYPEGDWEGHSIYSIPSDVQTVEELLRSNSPNPTQFYWFRTAFLREYSLTFYPKIKHEDSLFTPKAIATARKIQIHNEPQYHFLKRPNSTTTTLSEKRIYDYQTVLDQSYAFMRTIKEASVRKAYRGRLADIVMSYFDTARRIGPSCFSEVHNWLENRKYFLLILKYSKKKNTVFFYYIQAVLPFKTIYLYNFVAKIRYRNKS